MCVYMYVYVCVCVFVRRDRSQSFIFTSAVFTAGISVRVQFIIKNRRYF